MYKAIKKNFKSSTKTVFKTNRAQPPDQPHFGRLLRVASPLKLWMKQKEFQ